MDPGLGGSRVPELDVGPEGLEAGLLDKILGVRRAFGQPRRGTIEILGVHEDLLLEPPDERVRCLRVHRPPQGRET